MRFAGVPLNVPNGLELRMRRLQERWRRKLEVEAKECEHAPPPQIDDSSKKMGPVTKAPPPVAEVGGRGVMHGPKPTEVLSNFSLPTL